MYIAPLLEETGSHKWRLEITIWLILGEIETKRISSNDNKINK